MKKKKIQIVGRLLAVVMACTVLPYHVYASETEQNPVEVNSSSSESDSSGLIPENSEESAEPIINSDVISGSESGVSDEDTSNQEIITENDDTMEDNNSESTSETAEPNTRIVVNDDGTCDIIASGYEIPTDIKKVTAAVWSAEGGQDDLKWYTMDRGDITLKNTSEDSYIASEKENVFSAEVNLRDHGAKNGIYYAHIYYQSASGQFVLMEPKTFEVTDLFHTEVKAEQNDSGYTLILNDPSTTPGTVTFAVWSAEGGQDDLNWYSAVWNAQTKQASCQWNNKKLKHSGLVYIHCYVRDAGGTMHFEGQTTINVEKPKTEVTAEENLNGYQLKLTCPSTTPSSVRFAIWSSEGGQDDLKWYSASWNAASEQAVYQWDGGNLKHSGTVNIHCYVVDSKGNLTYQGSATVTITRPEVGTITSTYKQSTGAFHITLSDITGASGISSITVPIWCSNDQSDLQWYQAKKQSDGTWTVDGNISGHGYLTGQYHVHVYITDRNKTMYFTNKNSFSASLSGTITVETLQAGVSYQAVVSGVSLNGLKNVQIAVWTQKNGQDDLKWYTAKKNSQGQWTAVIPITDHPSLGTTYAHAYLRTTAGDMINTSDLRTSYLEEYPDQGTAFTFTDRQSDNGSFEINASFNYPELITKVQFPVWTENNGQDEIEWLTAEKQSDGTWSADVRIAKHLYESGKYCIHCYLTYSTGQCVYAGSSGFTVSSELAFYTAVDSEAKATAIVQGYTDASEVKVLVWSVNGGNDDQKWYQASRTGTGWSATILKSNHGSAGTYIAQFYVNGSYMSSDSFSFDDHRTLDSWYSISSAHAAGALGDNNEYTYTNCLTAMNTSYAEGYRTFEIDVILTSDQVPVLTHRWTDGLLDNYTYSAATSDGPTYSAFMNDTMCGGRYKPTDFKQLLAYLAEHSDVKVLLDTGYRTESDIRNLYTNLVSVAAQNGELSVLKKQIIPYFFNESMYTWINSTCSFREYHYATYVTYPSKTTSIPASEFQSILQFCKQHKVLSVSTWDHLATQQLINMADAKGITFYVHTTDNASTASRLLNMGVAGIVSNTITPVQAVSYIS